MCFVVPAMSLGLVQVVAADHVSNLPDHLTDSLEGCPHRLHNLTPLPANGSMLDLHGEARYRLQGHGGALRFAPMDPRSCLCASGVGGRHRCDRGPDPPGGAQPWPRVLGRASEPRSAGFRVRCFPCCPEPTFRSCRPCGSGQRPAPHNGSASSSGRYRPRSGDSPRFRDTGSAPGGR
jgi:hypothetical protein